MTRYMDACTDLNYKLLLIRAMKATKQWNIHSFIYPSLLGGRGGQTHIHYV